MRSVLSLPNNFSAVAPHLVLKMDDGLELSFDVAVADATKQGRQRCRRTVAIIGAGASGIPAAKQALEYGFEPVVFEASDGIGGLWRYKPDDTDESSVMKSTVINTSKEMTAYSDFPPPDDFANFMHNRKMLEYLELYANAFGLFGYLRLKHRVMNVRRSASFAADGSWLVSYATPSGELKEEQFSAVLLCTGHHTKPHWPPEWPEQRQFAGKISHAHSYKDHRGFEDTTVVVVGVGNSGVDIAVELSRISSQVYLCTRRGTWVLHRNLDYSKPFDLVLNTRFFNLSKEFVPKCMTSRYLRAIAERRLNHRMFGLKPEHDILGAHFTVNDELPNRLSCGTVRVRPNIRRFVGPNGVQFDDGSEASHVDHLILATGYSFEFPILEHGKLICVQENDVSLYLNMYPPELAAHNTLAVVGLIQPLGSIMPIAEMQARLFFDHLIGGAMLPGERKMRDEIGAYKRTLAERYVESRRHTIQVDYVEYVDKLASLIGCRPRLLRTLFWDADWPLFRALLLGPNAPYVYRLHGPKQWPDARQTLLDLGRRVRSGMRGSSLPAKCRRCGAPVVGVAGEGKKMNGEARSNNEDCSRTTFSNGSCNLCEQCVLSKGLAPCSSKLYFAGTGILVFVLLAVGFVFYWMILISK